MILQNIISTSGSKPVYMPPIEYGVVLRGGIDTDLPTQLFVQPYIASEWPEIPCDKTYFFLMSTDHGRPLPKQDRSVWGKGNNLDLSDYEDIGVLNLSPETTELEETCSLLRFPSQDNVINIYYQVAHERGISVNNEAETRCQYTDGGLLHEDIWTKPDPINVLGEDLPQDHTGYLKIWNIEGVLKGTHYKEQSLPSFITGSVQVSTTVNGLDWTRGHLIDLDSAADEGRFFFPSYGEYFKMYGQWWWIGTDQAKVGSSLTSATRGLVLCRSNESLELTEQIMRLDNGVFAVESWHPKKFPNENIIHLYGTNINEGTTKYMTLDLQFLINYV